MLSSLFFFIFSSFRWHCDIGVAVGDGDAHDGIVQNIQFRCFQRLIKLCWSVCCAHSYSLFHFVLRLVMKRFACRAFRWNGDGEHFAHRQETLAHSMYEYVPWQWGPKQRKLFPAHPHTHESRTADTSKRLVPCGGKKTSNAKRKKRRIMFACYSPSTPKR